MIRTANNGYTLTPPRSMRAFAVLFGEHEANVSAPSTHLQATGMPPYRSRRNSHV
jgi:hypothetical protein